jgi:hypothetical protein
MNAMKPLERKAVGKWRLVKSFGGSNAALAKGMDAHSAKNPVDLDLLADHRFEYAESGMLGEDFRIKGSWSYAKGVVTLDPKTADGMTEQQIKKLNDDNPRGVGLTYRAAQTNRRSRNRQLYQDMVGFDDCRKVKSLQVTPDGTSLSVLDEYGQPRTDYFKPRK